MRLWRAVWKAETKEKKPVKASSGSDPEDVADRLLKFVMSNGGAMRAFQEENASDDAEELRGLHDQYTHNNTHPSLCLCS